MGDLLLSDDLSRRERQVVEILIRLGRATGRDVERELPEAPTYSAVRSILRILTEKGVIQKKSDGERDWYSLSIPAAKARQSALRALVQCLFSNSASDAACALLGDRNVKLSEQEAEKLIKLIKESRGK